MGIKLLKQYDDVFQYNSNNVATKNIGCWFPEFGLSQCWAASLLSPSHLTD